MYIVVQPDPQQIPLLEKGSSTLLHGDGSLMMITVNSIEHMLYSVDRPGVTIALTSGKVIRVLDWYSDLQSQLLEVDSSKSDSYKDMWETLQQLISSQLAVISKLAHASVPHLITTHDYREVLNWMDQIEEGNKCSLK